MCVFSPLALAGNVFPIQSSPDRVRAWSNTKFIPKIIVKKWFLFSKQQDISELTTHKQALALRLNTRPACLRCRLQNLESLSRQRDHTKDLNGLKNFVKINNILWLLL